MSRLYKMLLSDPNPIEGVRGAFVFSGAAITESAITIQNAVLGKPVVSGVAYRAGRFVSATISSGGEIHLSSGGRSLNTTVANGGEIHLSSGGTAISTFLSSGGALHVHSGGTATHPHGPGTVSLDYAASMTIADGASVGSATYAGLHGILCVSKGGTVGSVHLGVPGEPGELDAYRGDLRISNGGVVRAAYIEEPRTIAVAGGTASNVSVCNGGQLRVSSGGTATGASVRFLGGGYVSSCGRVNSTIVSRGGYLRVYNSGVANSITACSGAIVFVSSGGTAQNITVDYAASLVVSSGGTALNVKENGGYVQIQNGATVTFAENTINPDVFPVGTATTIVNGSTVYSSNYDYIKDLVTLHSPTKYDESGITISSGGGLFLYGASLHGGVGSSGKMVIASGVSATAAIASGGSAYVLSGGFVSARLYHGGHLFIYSGASAFVYFDVDDGVGDLYAYSGAVITTSSPANTLVSWRYISGSGVYPDDDIDGK